MVNKPKIKTKKYYPPLLKVKKVKPNFFFQETITDQFNTMGLYYIASSDIQECCSGCDFG